MVGEGVEWYPPMQKPINQTSNRKIIGCENKPDTEANQKVNVPDNYEVEYQTDSTFLANLMSDNEKQRENIIDLIKGGP